MKKHKFRNSKFNPIILWEIKLLQNFDKFINYEINENKNIEFYNIKLLKHQANDEYYYVKFITGMKVNDSTGGFNGYSRDALESILKNKITFQGYAFQIQMKFIGYKLGFKIKEIPIIFKDREIGESKMSINIFYEAFFGILGMKIKSLLFPLKS